MPGEEPPFKLQPYNLGTTLEQWAKGFGLLTASGGLDTANGIQDGEHLQAFQEKCPAMTVETCEGCKMQGHKLNDCHPFINHVMGDALMKRKPETAASVWKKIHHFC